MTTTDTPYRDQTREQLYELAQERDIDGRSQMSKDELVAALTRSDQGPDAVDLLRRQHDAFRELFDEFRGLSARASQRKATLVRELITLLVKHSEIEEQVFYPAVRNEVPDVADDIDEDLEEHHAAELLLAELDHMTPDAERYDAKVTVLIEHMTHHLEEEEQDLFPKVRAGLDEQRRRDLGRAMLRMWEVAPTRPHPLSPSRPPANVLAGLPATVWDLTVGALRWARRTVGQRLPGR